LAIMIAISGPHLLQIDISIISNKTLKV